MIRPEPQLAWNLAESIKTKNPLALKGSLSHTLATVAPAVKLPLPESTRCADISAPPKSLDFGAFYRATLAPLSNYLARVLGCRTEAQDLAQNAFIRTHSAMSEQTVREPRLFLFTTARRLALDELRRRRRRPVDYVDGVALNEAAAAAPAIEDVLTAREQLARLKEMLEQLPPGCRKVFWLCKVEQLTHAEIAARLGIARSTVEKQVTRAFRLLREAYDEADALENQRAGTTAPREKLDQPICRP